MWLVYVRKYVVAYVGDVVDYVRHVENCVGYVMVYVKNYVMVYIGDVADYVGDVTDYLGDVLVYVVCKEYVVVYVRNMWWFM